jgi:hypothetical protein
MSNSVSSDDPILDAELYPDLVEQGGLGPALQRALASAGSALHVSEDCIEAGRRACHVYVADQERLFLCNFRDHGLLLARARTAHLAEVVALIHAWLEEGVSTTELRRRFPFTETEPVAEPFEEGSHVEWKWEQLEQDVAADKPKLLPLLHLARNVPALRQLFPFTSVWTLCFSRCTVYPYSADCPSATPNGDTSYTVRDAAGTVIGTGLVKEAVDMLVHSLPPGCGPAVKGSDDDLG